MEELRSAEVLDREIQAEARKKAEKIIKNAEAEAQRILAEVEDRLSDARAEKEAKFSRELDSFKRDLEASLPLEKERFLVSYIQSSIDRGMDEFFSSLSDEELGRIFVGELSRYEEKLDGAKVCAYVYGLEPDFVKKILGKHLDFVSVEKTEFNKRLPEKSFGFDAHRGVILETDDRQIRIRLTESEIVSQLEEKYRRELYTKLFDGRL